MAVPAGAALIPIRSGTIPLEIGAAKVGTKATCFRIQMVSIGREAIQPRAALSDQKSIRDLKLFQQLKPK